MKNFFLIISLFCIFFSEYCCVEQKNFFTREDRELLFLHLLLAWYERINLMHQYMPASSTFLKNLDSMDLAVISSFRDPSCLKIDHLTSCQKDFFNFYELLLKINKIFFRYVFLTNLAKEHLDEDQKAVLSDIKTQSLRYILMRILTLKNLYTFCENFYDIFLNKNARSSYNSFGLQDCSLDALGERGIALNIFDNINYYKSLYVRTDKVMVKILSELLDAKAAIKKVMAAFWDLVSLSLLETIKNEYNKRISCYVEQFGDLRILYIDKCILEELPKEIG